MKKFLSLIFIPLLLLCGCSKKQITDTKLYMDTVCTITADCSENTLDGAFEVCEHLDRMLAPNSQDSEISMMNYYDEFEMSDDTRNIIVRALYYCQKTGGKYDITLTPAIEQWDFEKHILPDFNELNRVLYRVGYDRIEIKDNYIDLHNADIDLGSIAKGYVADKTVEYLKQNGAKNGIVNLGGNVKVFGKAYNVGIVKPFSDEIMLTVKIKNSSAVTSGIYQRCFEHDGKLYHHILDVNTGLPVENELASVTILGESSTECDVLSTVCMILGEKAAISLINETDGYEAVFIKKDNSVSVSNGLKIKNNKIVYK